MSRTQLAVEPELPDRGFYAIGASLIAIAALYPVLGFGTAGLIAWTVSFYALLAALANRQAQVQSRKSVTRALHAFALAVAVAVVVCHAGNERGHGWTLVAVNSLILAYLVLTTAGLASAVFGSESTSPGVLCGAACVYVLIGLTWSYAYHVLHGLGVTTPLASPTAATDPAMRHAEILYFSFVTLSTVGYGDITPDTLVLRVTAASEAITGQVFLTILVARVVGLHVRSDRRTS